MCCRLAFDSKLAQNNLYANIELECGGSMAAPWRENGFIPSNSRSFHCDKYIWELHWPMSVNNKFSCCCCCPCSPAALLLMPLPCCCPCCCCPAAANPALLLPLLFLLPPSFFLLMPPLLLFIVLPPPCTFPIPLSLYIASSHPTTPLSSRWPWPRCLDATPIKHDYITTLVSRINRCSFIYLFIRKNAGTNNLVKSENSFEFSEKAWRHLHSNTGCCGVRSA